MFLLNRTLAAVVGLCAVSLWALEATAAKNSGPGSQPPLAYFPKYVVKVLVVRTCDDDGTHCSTVTQAQAQAGLDATNLIHQRSNSGIKFVLDPQSNFTGFINRTALNADCVVPAGVVPEQVTDPSIDVKQVCDKTVPFSERTAYALQFPQSIVAFTRGQGGTAVFDKDAGHWTVTTSAGGYSSCDMAFVVLAPNFGAGTFFAHESGHYLCTPHTFSERPKDVPGAAKIIREYVEQNNIDRNSPKAVLKVFDGDWTAKIYDTPPDAGDELFSTVNGNKCDPNKGTVSVPVTFSNNQTKTYVLQPARDNVMSYFKACATFDHRFTHDQVQTHIATITGKRHTLIASQSPSCYGGLADIPGGMSIEGLISYRARIIANCVRPVRRLKPGEVFLHDIYMKPAEIIRRATAEIDEIERAHLEHQ
jgi:hypothetical protein